MPIPNPKGKEGLSNCIEFEAKEGKPVKQAAAICYSERRRGKKRTKEDYAEAMKRL